jgi:hypothetical protein
MRPTAIQSEQGAAERCTGTFLAEKASTTATELLGVRDLHSTSVPSGGASITSTGSIVPALIAALRAFSEKLPGLFCP